MSVFFITGLPRSRSKWFADYFSGVNHTICWHEAMNGCRSELEFMERMTRLPFRHIGNSDSGLMFSRFQQIFMGAPTVIIERDIDDVACSLERQLGKTLCEEGEMRPFLEKQAERLKSVQGLRVPFGEIDGRLQEIHEYLVSVPFDDEYAQEQIKSNRQVDVMKADLASFEFWTGGV